MPDIRSPQATARIAGVFYLLTFVTGAGSMLLGSGLVVRDDAVATASNILAHPESFRFAAVGADLLGGICYVGVTALFYLLFRPVNRTVSLLAAFFSLVGCAIGAVATVLHLAPLALLGGAQYLAPFSAEQLQALSMLFLKLYNQAFSAALAFFGCYCLLIGYLVYRSVFLPRALGVLMAIGGIGWLTFLWAPLASALYPYVLAPGILGEGALTLWLLAFGVDAGRWRERAAMKEVLA
jgi:hypothetical protein